MFITNYNITETSYGLSFDEDFDPTLFNVTFKLDPDDEVSPSGWVSFQPHKGLATLYYYGHPEDLSASIIDYNLCDSSLGCEVVINFNEYKLGGLYRAAKAYTIQVVQAYRAAIEHLWNEYNKERA